METPPVLMTQARLAALFCLALHLSAALGRMPPLNRLLPLIPNPCRNVMNWKGIFMNVWKKFLGLNFFVHVCVVNVVIIIIIILAFLPFNHAYHFTPFWVRMVMHVDLDPDQMFWDFLFVCLFLLLLSRFQLF